MVTPSSSGRQPTLPSPLTPLIGRQTEIADVVAMLSQPDVRLVTLIGPGGTGKTRLALAVAERLQEQFQDGATFVPLHSVSDPDHVALSIAHVLGARDVGDRDVTGQLIELLHDLHLLLVLDNFEQVLPAASLVADLLDGCPRLSILVTSRAVLNLYGEFAYLVPPLAVPDSAARLRHEEVRESDAVRLFTTRAKAARSGFTLTPQNARVVAAICSKVGGLPLAIELAASRIRMFPPQELLQRLEQPLGLLTGGPRDVPARQRTIRETIAWSYGLLAPTEQGLLCQLAVFDGWTLEAAEAVCDPAVTSLENLEALVTHSLVRQIEQPDGSVRFDMLDTIRDFGLEQFSSPAALNAIRQRHAEYFLRTFEDAEAEWSGPEAARWALRSQVEFGNLRNALTWAVEHDADIALRLIQIIGGCWETLGYYNEARRWCELALASKQPASPSLRAYALFEAGFLATTQGDYRAGWDFNAEGLALYRSIGDRDGEAWCLYGMGRAAMWAANLDRAAELYEATIAVARDRNDRLLRSALGNLGAVYVVQGRFADAEPLLLEAIDRARRADHVVGLGFIIPEYALLALREGDTESATQRLAEALQIQRQLHDPRYASQAIEVAAWIAGARRQPLRAARLLGAVSSLRQAIGIEVPPMTRRYYDAYLPLTQAQVDQQAWDAAWKGGHAMSLEEAIDFALAADSPEDAAEPQPITSAGLSRREIEVLRLLVEGRSNQEIAATLSISPNTVANHVANVMNKLGVDSRTAAATWAVRHGLG